MVEEVDSMCYIREEPWHGLGARVVESLSSTDVLWLARLAKTTETA